MEKKTNNNKPPEKKWVEIGTLQNTLIERSEEILMSVSERMESLASLVDKAQFCDISEEHNIIRGFNRFLTSMEKDISEVLNNIGVIHYDKPHPNLVKELEANDEDEDQEEEAQAEDDVDEDEALTDKKIEIKKALQVLGQALDSAQPN